MNTKILRPKNISLTMIGLAALICAAFLSGVSCNLPGGPDTAGGTGTLTLLLPETGGRGTGVQNKTAAVSRSVLSDGFTGTLVYKLTITGSGDTQTLDAEGGGTTVTLVAGEWTIEAAAYDPGNLSVMVGSGSAAITVVSGQSSSVRIPMTIDPAYEAGLTKIYIHNEAELRRVGTDFAIDGSIDFYLESDIVLTQPWTPIGGSSDAPFRAVFDGQGHTIIIKSFSGPILDGNAAGLGFFAYVDGATIQDVTINYELGGPVVDMRTGEGLTYYGGNAGGVAGCAANASFENIQVTGNFSVIFDGDSSLSVGGIAGQADYGVTITNCRVTGTIGGTSANSLTIGGIAGYISAFSYVGGDISESSFTGTVSGNAPSGNCEAGGIAGYVGNAEITACFAEGSIKAEADSPRVGGIAGKIDASSGISKSYAAGVIESIAATDSYSIAGGIAGFSDGTIENCYAWASVSTSSTYGENAGGIAGMNSRTISKCYTAGTVRSKGHDPYTYVGGVTGSDQSQTVSGCIGLVSELDGGPSSSTLKNVYAIGSSYGGGTFSGNYALAVSGSPGVGVVHIHNNTNASDQGVNAQDGGPTALADFKNQITNPYTTAGWDFSGVWKWISGWDYPVLKWQDAAPGAGMGNAGVEVEIDWL